MIWLIKDEQNRLHPCYEADREKVSKIKVGEPVLFSYASIRNPRLHRKYFGLIRLAFENQSEYSNVDSFRESVQMEAGYAEPTPFYCRTEEQKAKFIKWMQEQIENIKNNKPIMFPHSKSIAYDKMDNDAFSDLYEAVWRVLYDRYAFDRELFENELIGFL